MPAATSVEPRITDADMADLPLATAHPIDVVEFVPAAQIDPPAYVMRIAILCGLSSVAGRGGHPLRGARPW